MKVNAGFLVEPKPAQDSPLRIFPSNYTHAPLTRPGPPQSHPAPSQAALLFFLCITLPGATQLADSSLGHTALVHTPKPGLVGSCVAGNRVRCPGTSPV